MNASLSTLCYIEKDGKYLMLHRTVKKNDVNKDKWIGVGGHFEYGECPEDCVLREVKEETGYTLTSFQYRGLVTFVFADVEMEYMSLFTADGFEGEPAECDEGVLEWIAKEELLKLNLWEGDKIFLKLLDTEPRFFSLKLCYSKNNLISHTLEF
jgi:8-oxo-dGTP diphosphatase